jgi:cytochrome d ubiquinol oxidase subunit I
MIGLGMGFIGLTLLASFLHWRQRLYQTRWLLWIFVFAVVGPFVANELGWIAAEVGRQPWIVHPPVEWTADGDLVVGPSGLVEYDETLGLRTADAVSASVSGSQVLTSLIGFSIVYLGLLAAWLFVLDSKIRHGPEPVSADGEMAGDGLMAAVAARFDRPGPADDPGGGS